MPREILIDPVTRIEGHSKITLQLDDSGNVTDAKFHVTQFRGFEKLCEGRPMTEMPSLTARTCGICPVSHLTASAKACDDLLSVKIPESAANLRRIMNLAQLVQSHALSFFHLSSPDLLMGFDADPAGRHLFGVFKENPQLARDGIRVRQIGQTVIEILGGKKIHPPWDVAGGVNKPLDVAARDKLMAMMPEGLDIATRTLAWYKRIAEGFSGEAAAFANFPTLFMGLVTDSGGLEHYDGWLRVVDSKGEIIVDRHDPKKYMELIAEAAEPYTFMKFPYFKKLGYPQGIYRVGPLARLNLIDHCGTPIADQEWAEFRQIQRGAVLSSFHYHHARLIEIIFAFEIMQQLLSDPKILDKKVRARRGRTKAKGSGSPRRRVGR